MTTILALLQNQWFRDAERAAKLLDQYIKHEGGYWEGRARFSRDMLFMGCLTGRRIEKAFGDELCDYGGMVFEETSPQLGGKSGAVFPPDEKHLLGLLDYHKPGLIVAFGKVASAGLQLPALAPQLSAVQIIETCHPAARGNQTVPLLGYAGSMVKAWRAGT